MMQPDAEVLQALLHAAPDALLAVGQAVRVLGLGLQPHQVDDVDDAHLQVGQVLAGKYKAGSVPELWDGSAGERIGRLIAGTESDEVNSTAAREFAHTLGSSQTFQLRRQDERRDEEAGEQGSGSRRRSSPESGATATQAKQRTARKLTARLAFRPALSAPELEQRVREGMAVRQTKLTEQHTLDDFLERQPDAVLMFVVQNGQATVVAKDTAVPQEDATLVALVRPRSEVAGGR